ncbi:MAG TPA: response regulator [Verrucomicrobiae bacterium]|jgi:CheY-like chemotaxis protein|nr:response regulator [Verrucomicrobiae bacterium]
MGIQPEPPLGKRILLVEDERSVRDTLRQLLCLDDHTVIEANNGAEALRLFAQDQFDVVLTDCLMPFLKGTELATRIKQISPNQPILMITAVGIRPGPHNGVDAVLRKPFDLDKLRSALAEVFAVPV